MLFILPPKALLHLLSCTIGIAVLLRGAQAGKVVEQGTYAKLSAADGELCALMEAYGQTQGEEEDGSFASANDVDVLELPTQGGSVRASLDTR